MKQTDIEFEALFKKVAFQDDEKAYKELFVEFYPSMCVFAIRYVSHEEIAKDIVQEVFFKIWKNRKSIYIDTSFRNFLITSVRNICIDYIRRKGLENRYMEKNLLYSIYTSPEEEYTLKELKSTIDEALDKLPPKVREAFEMSRYNGMTYIDIADQMELSPKTIELYISKALNILRIELSDYLLFILLFL